MKNPLGLAHRIETRRLLGRVHVALGGEVLADSGRALQLDERGLPPRYYLPREDVHVELLPSEKRTTCPFKGHATHYSLRVNDVVHHSIAWSYEDPIPAVAEIRGLVAFYDERVELTATAPRGSRRV